MQTDGAFRSTYYVEADNLISGTELRDYVAKVAAVDLLYSDDDEAEELEVLDPVELEENIVFDCECDDGGGDGRGCRQAWCGSAARRRLRRVAGQARGTGDQSQRY